MDDFTREGDEVEVRIPLDEQGFLGRECPEENCLGYFKVEPGTGVTASDLQTHCPYCGHVADPDHFWTKEQIEYAESIALREFMGDIDKELRKLEVRPAKGALFSIGITVEAEPLSIARYAEKELETEIVCGQCTLRYAIYGVFGYCPDCGSHNSLQILRTNLQIARKILQMAPPMDGAIQKVMTENALQTIVAAFDGFGRELVSRYASRSTDAAAAAKLTFQAIDKAAERVQRLFGLDVHDVMTDAEWRLVNREFQKRHLLAHRAGVIDEQYVVKTGADAALIGRKVEVRPADVAATSEVIERYGAALHGHIARGSA